MLFQAINPTTLIFIVSFLIIIGTFLLVGMITLRRNPSSPTNQTFAAFFFVVALGLTLNIPAPFMVDNIRVVLIKLTAYAVAVGLGILLIFTLILRFSNQVVTNKRKWIIVFLYALIFSAYFFIPDGVHIELIDGIATTRYSPLLAGYFLLGTQLTFGLIILFVILIYKNFGDRSIQKRYRSFILGLFCFEVMLILIPLLNAGWVPTILNILLFLAFPGAILVYLGVGKHL